MGRIGWSVPRPQFVAVTSSGRSCIRAFKCHGVHNHNRRPSSDDECRPNAYQRTCSFRARAKRRRTRGIAGDCHSERRREAPQARNRDPPGSGPPDRDECDSSPPGLRPSARNDKARRFLASAAARLRSERQLVTSADPCGCTEEQARLASEHPRLRCPRSQVRGRAARQAAWP